MLRKQLLLLEINQDATNMFLLKGNKRNTRKKRELCSKLQ